MHYKIHVIFNIFEKKLLFLTEIKNRNNRKLETPRLFKCYTLRIHTHIYTNMYIIYFGVLPFSNYITSDVHSRFDRQTTFEYDLADYGLLAIRLWRHNRMSTWSTGHWTTDEVWARQEGSVFGASVKYTILYTVTVDE